MGKGAGFLVVGPPAVGKSTVARLLATTAPRGVHVPVDHLREMVVSGLRLPGPEWTPELADQVAAAREVACAALSSYAARGWTVVVDDFVDPLGLREYDQVVASEAVVGVVLRPDVDTAVARARRRETTEAGATYIIEGVRSIFGHLDRTLPRLVDAGWHVVDNTHLDPEATAARIRELTPRSGSGPRRAPGRT